MSDDALVAHQASNELEVAAFGEVDGHAVTVRYPLKGLDIAPLGLAPYVRVGEWILTPSEAVGLASLLRDAAHEASSRQPVLRPVEVWARFDQIVAGSKNR
jgi:hypothetical protein